MVARKSGVRDLGRLLGLTSDRTTPTHIGHEMKAYIIYSASLSELVPP